MQGNLEVRNSKGLHARCASMVVECCKSFVSEIHLKKGTTSANAKSIIGLMLLEATQGTVLTVEIEGPDEADAYQALQELFGSGFGEKS